MKKSIALLCSVLLFALAACSEKTTKDAQNHVSNKQETKVEAKVDPVPKTITLQEVSRIALVEAKQFLDNAKKKGNIELSPLANAYNEAQKLYDNGEFKKAQIKAVDVRHQVEKVLIAK
jgi:Tfp pilus assembly protein PilP